MAGIFARKRRRLRRKYEKIQVQMSSKYVCLCAMWSRLNRYGWSIGATARQCDLHYLHVTHLNTSTVIYYRLVRAYYFIIISVPNKKRLFLALYTHSAHINRFYAYINSYLATEPSRRDVPPDKTYC